MTVTATESAAPESAAPESGAPESAAPAQAAPQEAGSPFAPARLAERARALADHPEEWVHRVRLDPQGRWYERLHQDADHEIWLISWLPGQATGFHDHGGSAGAFAVALGTLEEHRVHDRREVGAGQVRSFGPDYVHDVRNTSDAPAVSVHVYSPPLSTMRRYDLDAGGELVRLTAESAEDW